MENLQAMDAVETEKRRTSVPAVAVEIRVSDVPKVL